MTALGSLRRINLPFVLVIGLPVFAILASVGVAAVAVMHGDPTLPDDYHWEGMKLDHDFARSQRAATLDVRATLQIPSKSGLCRVRLSLDSGLPRKISLTFVHGAYPRMDRHVELIQRGGLYEAVCEPLPAGLWHVEMSDPVSDWSVREDIEGTFEGLISLAARGAAS